MSKKKNKNYLTAEQRPLFAPVHCVHLTKKDKEKSRATQKKRLREEMRDL